MTAETDGKNQIHGLPYRSHGWQPFFFCLCFWNSRRAVLWINYQPARTTFELTPLAYSRGFILLLVLGRCFLLIL